MLLSTCGNKLIVTDPASVAAGLGWVGEAGGDTRTTTQQRGTYPSVTILCYANALLAVPRSAHLVLNYEVYPMANAPTNAPMRAELEHYLQEHPQAREYLRKFEQAQAAFGGYLQLAQPHIVLRELDGGSTIDVDPNAAISRANT